MRIDIRFCSTITAGFYRLYQAGILKLGVDQAAGPGFINFTLTHAARFGVIKTVLEEKETFGKGRQTHKNKILLEFISSNPTGPLHVGHGHSAAYGASLASLMKAAGYDIHCEYYVNDAGRQMEILDPSSLMTLSQLMKALRKDQWQYCQA